MFLIPSEVVVESAAACPALHVVPVALDALVHAVLGAVPDHRGSVVGPDGGMWEYGHLVECVSGLESPAPDDAPTPSPSAPSHSPLPLWS